MSEQLPDLRTIVRAVVWAHAKVQLAPLSPDDAAVDGLTDALVEALQPIADLAGRVAELEARTAELHRLRDEVQAALDEVIGTIAEREAERPEQPWNDAGGAL